MDQDQVTSYEREVPGGTLSASRDVRSKQHLFTHKYPIVLPRKGGVGHDRLLGWYISYREGGEYVKEPVKAADLAEALAARDRRHVELQMTRDATYGGTRDGTASRMPATVGSHGRPRGRRARIKEEDAIVAYDTVVVRYRVFFGGRQVRDVDSLTKARALLERCNKRMDPLSKFAKKCACCGRKPRTGEVNGIYFVCHEEHDCENRIFLRQGNFKTGVLLAAWNEMLYDKAGQERWRIFRLQGGVKGTGRAPKNFQFPDGWRPPDPPPLRRRRTKKMAALEEQVKAGVVPDEYADEEASMPQYDEENGPNIDIDTYEP